MREVLHEIEVERLGWDPEYLDDIALLLLARCHCDADHVELRRVASRLFPGLGRAPATRALGAVVGRAATLRASEQPRPARDVTDVRLDLTATEPLDYPASYAQLDEGTRALLIAFCERELGAGNDGPIALANLLRLHGWPFSERTFYVGPWKAARLRARRRNGGGRNGTGSLTVHGAGR